MEHTSFVCPDCKRTLSTSPGWFHAVKRNGQQLCMECSQGKTLRNRVGKAVGLIGLILVVFTFWTIVVLVFVGLEAAGVIELQERAPGECNPWAAYKELCP